MNSNWTKVASVTPGGKPFFYVRGQQRIVWDRYSESFKAHDSDKLVGYFDDIRKAKRAFS